MQNQLHKNCNRSKVLFHAGFGWILATAVFLAVCNPGLARQAAPAPAAPALAEATNDVATPAPADSPATDEDSPSDRHEAHAVIFSDYVLEAGRTNYGDAPVIKGSTTIDGVVTGDSVTVFGNAKVNGTVKHDLVVVMGSAELGSNAVVGGQVVVVGGKLTRAAGAKINEEPVVIDLNRIPGLGGIIPWITKGLMLGRPLPFGVGWAWLVGGLFLLINLLLLVLFPRPIQACVETVERQPIGSLFAGILVKLLLGLVIVLLLISVVGIIVVPFLMAALVVAFLFGKITIYQYVGRQLGRQAHLDFLQAPALALILGTVVFYLLYAVPFLGFVAWGFTSVFGVGAVTMTVIQKFRDERAKARPRPTAPSPVPVGDAGLGGATATATADPNLAGSMPLTSESASLLEATTWPRAGFWLRLCSAFLDLILIMIPLAMVKFPMDKLGPGPFILIWLAYNIMLWFWKGTTVGGIVTGIKVIRTDGRPMQFPVALIRGLASLLSFAAMGLGFIWAGIGPEKRTWHDKIAGTMVVRVPHGVSLI